MSRYGYVDVDKLIEYANNCKVGLDANDIARFPKADVRENVRGEWCEYKNPTEQEIVLRLNRWICNKCFMPQRYTSKFCPNCGALMSESLKLAEVGKAIAEGLNEGLNCDMDMKGEENENR